MPLTETDQLLAQAQAELQAGRGRAGQSVV